MLKKKAKYIIINLTIIKKKEGEGMKNNMLKIIIIFALGIIMPLLYNCIYYETEAKTTFNPIQYIRGINRDSTTDTNEINNIGNAIIGAIKGFGIVTSVVAMIVMGIRYMAGSVEEKAEYKKSMLPYFLGALMVFTITTFLSIIIDIAKKI